MTQTSALRTGSIHSG
jgi:hypothetical protein